MTIRITNGDGTQETIVALNQGSGAGAVHHYTDVDGDRLAVFTSEIPDIGPGVYLRTDHSGCAVPLADLRALIDGIEAAAMEAGHAAGVDCRVPSCGPCSFDRVVPRAEGSEG